MSKFDLDYKARKKFKIQFLFFLFFFFSHDWAFSSSILPRYRVRDRDIEPSRRVEEEPFYILMDIHRHRISFPSHPVTV